MLTPSRRLFRTYAVTCCRRYALSPPFRHEAREARGAHVTSHARAGVARHTRHMPELVMKEKNSHINARHDHYFRGLHRGYFHA